MGQRLLSAGVLLIVAAVMIGILWLVSMMFYAIGLWPLGALTRIIVWGIAIFFLYWIARHLIQGQDRITRDEIERVLGHKLGQGPDDRMDS